MGPGECGAEHLWQHTGGVKGRGKVEIEVKGEKRKGNQREFTDLREVFFFLIING